jgi:hypothetical protein
VFGNHGPASAKDGIEKATWVIITGELLVPRWFRKADHKIFFKSEPRFERQPNPLAGDYSFNGIVDAADYTVWRDTLGSVNDLRADGSGAMVGVPDGVVDTLHFDFWKARFGHVLGVGGGGATALAEPVAPDKEDPHPSPLPEGEGMRLGRGRLR